MGYRSFYDFEECWTIVVILQRSSFDRIPPPLGCYVYPGEHIDFLRVILPALFRRSRRNLVIRVMRTIRQAGLLQYAPICRDALIGVLPPAVQCSQVNT
jgi:hypothetical protein